MTDKQQIEKFATDLCKACSLKNCKSEYPPCVKAEWVSEALYNAGYRKVKDYELTVSLNILDEEWEKIKNECLERVEYNITEIQKQTAKAIFTKLIEVAKNNDNKLSIGLLKAWAIEYGVEVEE